MRQKVLSTDRFFLTPFSNADLSDLHSLNKDPEVMKFIREPEKTLEVTLVSLERMLNHARNKPGLGFWKIIEKETKNFVGWVGILQLEDTNDFELGYRLKKEYWGAGIAVEASKCIIDYVKSEKILDQIVGVVDPRNVQSMRVMEKLNFEKVGRSFHYNKDLEKFIISFKTDSFLNAEEKPGFEANINS